MFARLKRSILFLIQLFVCAAVGAQTTISSLDEINNDPTGDYIITSDVSASGFTSIATFTGTLTAQAKSDGTFPVISNLSVPLFTTATDATISNIMLDNVSISQNGIVGAFAATAKGATRIYNCGILSGSVGSTGTSTAKNDTDCCGSIVGSLDGTARVINCFSYATITNGNRVGGIVGYNNGTTTASSITTMVMNCMFYGDITGGVVVNPVYGGNNINNLQGGLNTFNYYAYDELKTKSINYYNCALAVEEKFLNRHEFYRLLLNSNKKLAAYYASTSTATVNPGDMAKWVLETADRRISGRNPYPYPILKARGYYPSIINPDIANAPDSASVGRNHGGKLGKTLSVTISGVGSNAPTGAGITTSSLNLQRTDKDFDRFNYNYDKVQLPYYNDVGTGNYTGNKVVTGWKITAITAVAGDPYTSANYPTSGITDYPNHNYADRKSSNKDLYSVSGRVFSQGAYFDVPYGVTSITIEPYWGNAIYVSDPNYDVVYKADYSGKQNVTQTGTQATDNTTEFNGQKIRTKITGLAAGTTVYDNAVVLVGNFHLDNVPSNGTTPFTMMSVDEDNDHEPDYSLIYHHKKRLNICPIRFDFLNVIGTAQAQKPNNASLICNFTICKTRGWFEITNTALIYSSQFEYENLGTTDGDNRGKVDAPLILLGGVFDQFVSTQNSDVNGKVYYIHVGGNVWIKEFGMGTHSDGNKSTPHVPVSVTGGEFPGFYLTGTYNSNAAIRKDNAECYISGGYFHEAAGASQEAIDGNVRWQIYNADIDNFFGGGTNDAKPITGDVTIDIYNSYVTTYCGGPKFGNMQAGKKVTTNAEGCVFGTYFGAGYGGLSYSRKKYYDLSTYNWNTLQGYYTADRGKYYNGSSTGSSQQSDKDYGKKGPGVATDFDYEFFVWSSGQTGARFFVKFASFSLAQCNDVESKLKGCTVENNYYGGGSLGKVTGTVNSELEDCTVKGNVFGAGFSASLPTLEVRDAGFTQNPNYNSASGMFEPGVYSGTTTFKWTQDNFPANGSADPNFSSGKVTTNVDLSNTNLGSVEGDVNLTLNNTTVGTSGNSATGNVYGGGESSWVTGSNHTVNVLLEGETMVYGNVFGGGNEAGVIGSTNVTLTSGSVIGGIYGGCNADGSVGPVTIALNGGTAGTVYGGGFGSATTTTDNIGVTLNGSTINGDIYGGSALGSVNLTTASPLNTTTINLQTATLHGRVFGGGMGDNNTTPNPTSAISNGNAVVNINVANPYLTGIYGGANINGLVNGNIDVNVNANVGSTNGSSLDIFGGGYGANTNTNGNVTVTIGSLDGTYAPTIYGDIYGGSALGNVNDAAADLTKVDFLNGTLHGNIYGGGLGQRSPTPIAAKVNGQVQVNIGANGQNNCAIDLSDASVFGCNNTNGSPQDNVTVNIYCTAHNAQYGIDQVFGGGNQADYAPENGLATSTKRTTVNVIGCLNTIRRVFGGGNAAAALGVVTVIDGGTFDQVFGGGNGEDNAANIGAGGTNLTVHGGTINQLFGGSNTSGIIYGPMNTLVDGTGDCAASMNIAEFFCGNNLANIGTQENPTIINATIGCGTIFGDVYGGCSLADIYGDITLNIEGGTINRVFGGSKGDLASLGTGHIDKDANISGDVTLNITGGTIGSAFGGSNIYGNITGSIQVNVEKGANPCSWSIGNIYGASNDAAYTPTAQGNSLTVNIKNGNISGSVYGGGKGSTATVTSNPIVTIGDNNADHFVTVTGNVYGGGDAAAVVGNTTVIYNDNNTDSTVPKLFGGGNAASVSGTSTVTLRSGKVTQGVYGGCNSTGSVGNVLIALNGGSVGATGDGNSADVYGGGYGSATTTTGNIGVTLHGTTVYGDIYGGSALGSVNANTENTAIIILSTATLYGSVFGGGKGDNSNTAVSNGNTVVNINIANTNLTGIYGGANIRGNIKGATAVNIKADVGASGNSLDIFGGGYGANTNTEGNVTVTIGDVAGNHTPTIYGDIYGGSALGNVNNDANDITKVDFLNGTLHGNLYGGGLGDKESLGNGHSDVAAKVYGKVEVNIGAAGQSSCSIDLSSASVFGCNNTNGSPQDDVTVNVYCTGHDAKNAASYTESDATYAIAEVFGGGNQADYAPENGLTTSTKKATVNVIGCLNTIRRVFGGGNAAAAVGVSTNLYGGRYDYVFGGGNGEVTAANIGKGGTDLNVHGCNINHLFGGSNANGNISGSMGVNIDNTGGCEDAMYIAEFFCGNNLANVGTQENPIDINATIGCGTVFGDLYGGCNLADVYGNVTLTIEGGTMNNVYGGSKGRSATSDPNNSTPKAANINGNVTLNITGGSIGNAFGGSNINGNITGSIEVNVEKAANPCLWSLGNVYGASNEAAYTPTTPGSYPAVNIKNGAVTGNVFGGGLGATATVTSNPVVTIGDNTSGHESYVASVGGDVYGGGDAGNVLGTTHVNVVNKSNTTISGDVYGGGNAANVYATDVNIDGGNIRMVFGGGHGDKNASPQKEANVTGDGNEIAGNVTVDITGGTINKVFGGSNSKGSISGIIAVNINKDDNSCEMHINEVYGGGNEAAGNAGTITIGCTGGSNEGIGDVYGGANQADIGNNINLNITGGSIQNVFGGNNTSGTISGTIAVTVNWDTQDPCGYNYLGSVFGGGNLASYSGTPLVTITNGTVHNVYGGGNQADVAGATVNMNGGSVLNGLYGGCNTSGIVTGDIAVNINGGTVGTDANNTANIHGGGFGENTGTSGNVEVTIGSAVGAQTYPTIYGDVYGGSAMGKVNGTQLNNNLHTYVTLNAGTINGSLYGGALGAEGISANVYAPVTVTVNGGTVTGGVYGCNNVNGAPQGAVTVHINGTDQPATYAIAKVFGGGNKAAYSGTPQVRIHYSLSGEQNPNPNKIEYIYGGGNEATVLGTDVIVYGGSKIGYVFGGGYGADVTTDGTDVKIYGGTIGKVFGGNDQSGSVTGDISVLVNKQAEQGHEACLMKIDEVYGGGNLAASQAGNLTISSTGGDEEYISYVYGGANNAYVHGDITLNITSGRITEAVFGGNNTGNTVDGDVTVNVNWNNSDGANDRKYLKDVFGGGNQASVSGNTTVKLISGIISNDVYGGGKQAPVNGSTNVSIEGGTVTNDVYGGGMQGDVAGDVTVNISSASYNGNANVVTIYGSVYGGGALAHTNTANRSVNAQHEEVINLDESSKKTIVNLHPGATIGHDVYGGGRGQQPTDSDPGEAIVYGNVTVYQHGSILTAEYSNGLATRGRIFGGNNVNGSPRGHILVYVSKTTGTTGQMRSSETDRMSATAIHTYELAAVYGGGNQAEYLPYDVDNEYAEVHIDGCDDVSIHSVYGGGNAASAPATKVTIGGAYEIGYVFGGGNGAGSDNPGANVGYHYYDHEGAHGGLSDEDVAWRNDPENKLLYGKGTATTNVYGGRIHYIYGGSNTKGNVRKASVARLEELSSCPLNIDEIYGGGRAAYMDGSASLELGCISGLDAIYGGSERADIGKDIELTITSGKFKKVFGGNNVSGRIFGSIKVNIEQTGCLPIEIGELYGGGNLADYSVYGYDGDDLYYEPQPNTTAYDDPEINIKSFKSIETVYGGGYKAEMVGNPHININVVKGWTNGEYKGKGEGVPDDYAEYKNTPKNMDSMGEIGDVFGGGNEADVYGQTYINIGTDESIKIHSVPQYVYEIIKDNRTPDNNPSDITDPGYETDKETETKDLTIKVGGAIINGNVYGGGNKADVTEGSNITVGRSN